MSRVAGLVEVYQNPHPPLSHNKMWEREKEGFSHNKMWEREKEDLSHNYKCGRGYNRSLSPKMCPKMWESYKMRGRR